MDLFRAADLLESEFDELLTMPAWRTVPTWKRSNLENVARASIRALRDAGEVRHQPHREQTTGETISLTSAKSALTS